MDADDHYEPSFTDLQKAVAFIEQHAQRNEKVCMSVAACNRRLLHPLTVLRCDQVYVHCKSGHGRSAAVIMCWLLHRNADKGMTPFDANQLMLSKRDVRKKLFTQPNVLVRPSLASLDDEMRAMT